MKHEQNTNRLSEIAYRLANDQEIKSETINDLTTEERTALDVLLESGSMETNKKFQTARTIRSQKDSEQPESPRKPFSSTQ